MIRQPSYYKAGHANAPAHPVADKKRGRCALLFIAGLLLLYSFSQAGYAQSSVGWVVGAKATIQNSTNGGATWISQSPPGDDQLNDVFFVDGNVGWAVGNKGKIFATSNGGFSWAAQAKMGNHDLNGLHFSSSSRGWAVGASGKIFGTDDGGVSWAEQADIGGQVLHDVTFVDENRGWAVGASGRIYRTLNAGATWARQFPPNNQPLYGVHFFNADKGWAVGGSGKILSTSNSGVTWQERADLGKMSLRSVFFSGDQSGWVVSNDGKIFNTSNGGTSWQEQTKVGKTQLNAISFLNADMGCAVGNGGTVVITTDGGATWTSQTVSGNPNLMALALSSDVNSLAQRGVEVTGEAGWRILATPSVSQSVASLASQNMVQGVTGAFANEDPNLFTYTGTDWAALPSTASTLGAGEGFIWYLFDNDDETSKSLPFTLVGDGESVSSDVTVNLNGAGFTLVGNPFSGSLDLGKVTSSGAGTVQDVVSVWDPNKKSWVSLSFLAADVVSVWQGFFVEVTGGSATLTFPTEAQSTASPPFYGKGQGASSGFHLGLRLEGVDEASGQRTYDEAIALYFHDEAQVGWDRFDATKLTPLSTSYATMAVEGKRGPEELMLSRGSFPLSLPEGGQRTIPLHFEAQNMKGLFTLTWPELNLPNQWKAVLVDRESGIETYLDERTEYTFAAEAKAGKRPQSILWLPAIEPQRFGKGSSAEGRFVLYLTNQDAPNLELPLEVTLHKAYPNPFNPATTLSYSLPEQTMVQLRIYNLQGRLLETLVQEVQSAGRHEIRWQAAERASGLYLYRLEANGVIKSGTALLVR